MDDVNTNYTGCIIGLVLLLFLLFSLYFFVHIRQLFPDVTRSQFSVFRFPSSLPQAILEMRELVAPSSQNRFRKRDKLLFYQNKWLRYILNNSTNSEQQDLKEQHRVVKKEEENNRTNVAWKRPKIKTESASQKWWDPILQLVLQCDKNYLDLYNCLEVVEIAKGHILFEAGTTEDCLYIVRSGLIILYIDNETIVKTVKSGGLITSLMSFLDHLSSPNNDEHCFPLCAKAVENSVLLKLNFSLITDKLDKQPPHVRVQIVQNILVRLQRVFFNGITKYFGLYSQLVILPKEPPAKMDDGVDKLFCAELQTQTDLKHRIQVITVPSGGSFLKEGILREVGLYYILSGQAEVTQQWPNHSSEKQVLYIAKEGTFMGHLAFLTGEAHFFSASAKGGSCEVAVLKRTDFLAVTQQLSFTTCIQLVKKIKSSLSLFLRQLSYALVWLTIDSGQVLYHQNDATNGMFCVLSGRLRVYQCNSEKNSQDICGEMVGIKETRGQEALVGIMDVLLKTSRKHTAIAVRNSDLCLIPANLFEFLKKRYPSILSRFIDILGSHLVKSWKKEDEEENRKMFKTVALFPASESVPLTATALELQYALEISSTTLRLTSKNISAATNHDSLAWLHQQERQYDVILYVCDKTMTNWTLCCLSQADVIFDVAWSRDEPTVSDQETQMNMVARHVRKELVLLHDESTLQPKNTVQWLQQRKWISGHFHVKTSKRIQRSSDDEKLEKFYAKLFATFRPNIHSDFCRIARHITGNSVGIVLGGGGARGAAHIGILKAVHEAGIPIDHVGGVSIGAFVGALWCIHRDICGVTQKARDWFECIDKKWWRHVQDFTYPYTAIFGGNFFNYSIHTAMGDVMIEDLWIPYFCCSTDLSASRERVHDRGVLWRYCRASMSYALLMPPICDPVDGHLLIDGCYVNNVPGDTMGKQKKVRYILAIDVTAVDDRDLDNYGDTLSGWWILWKLICPFVQSPKIPNQAEIQLRLAFCSHYKNLEELKNNTKFEYIQPPVEKYDSGSFQLFEEIKRVGYHHGTTFFAGIRQSPH